MDGTLFNTSGAVEVYANKYLEEKRKTIKELFGKVPESIQVNRYALKSSSTTSWIRREGTNNELPEELAVEIRDELFHDINYWTNIPLMNGAYEIMEKLCRRHDVFIATSVFLANSEACMLGKPRSIKKSLPFFDIQKLIYTHFKYNLKGDCIIEDIISQVLPFNGMKIIFDYPYNRIESVENQIIRVTYWKELEALLL